jgi:ligand-binding SRPBCC domain-containing protein
MPEPHVYARSVEIGADAQQVYEFHLDTRNAPLISPLGATFLSIEGHFPVSEGARVTLKVRQSPIPFAQTWVVRIDELQVGRLVVDVAERSPFAEWRHEHRFAPLGHGRTLMTDHIEYRLPGGPLGRLANRLLAKGQLERMFEVRHARTKAHFEAAR